MATKTPSSKVTIGAVVGGLCLAVISIVNGLDLGFQIGPSTAVEITVALSALAAYLKPEKHSTV